MIVDYETYEALRNELIEANRSTARARAAVNIALAECARLRKERDGYRAKTARAQQIAKDVLRGAGYKPNADGAIKS